jgi:SNF2 family DNA or RNA helicase
MSLRNINIENFYDGAGEEITNEFVISAIGASEEFDRITSYFNVNSLIECAAGLDLLFKNKGKFRLIIGIHDVPLELLITADQEKIKNHIEEAKKKIYQECSSIKDALTSHRIGTLALLINSGFLEIRVAALKSGGLFHNKRLIFKNNSDAVVAVGSQNFTQSGMKLNSEELSIDKSWENPIKTKNLIDNFNEKWNNNDKNLFIYEITKDFANELLSALRENKISQKKSSNAAQEIFYLIKNSPNFWFTNCSSAALYPHQERAVRDGLSNWPIRLMLADEVGLGKTLEAATVVSFAKRYLNIKKIIIFTPANLRKQWQSELKNLFDIESYIYEPALQSYVDSSGKKSITHKKNENPVDFCPEISIVSWQLARNVWLKKNLINLSKNKINLIMVDEAHAARKQLKNNGSYSTTLVWDMLNSLQQEVDHLLLLTATPMQIQIDEYIGLLEILGLPDWWKNSSNFKLFLEALNSKEVKNLKEIKILVDSVSSSLKNFKGIGLLSDQSINLLNTFNLFDELSPQSLYDIKNHQSALRKLALDVSPIKNLTIRNTKKSLEKYNYKFPQRVFNTPSLQIGQAGKKLISNISTYINEYYGTVEDEIYQKEVKGKSFIKAVYYQRLVSSFTSAKSTLIRRKERLNLLVNNQNSSQALGKIEFDDDDEYLVSNNFDDGTQNELCSTPNLEVLNKKVKIEIQYIDGIIKYIDDITTNQDPKLVQTIKLLQEKVKNNSKVLLFSKYTDTLDSFICHITTYALPELNFGKYTGDEAYISISKKIEFVDKFSLTKALNNSQITVVFCSDAASEGLNLQSADTIINIDVPWNPAKLEQRIGRIARLGQKSPTVEIINLWYPGTIESQIYKQLINRQDLYNLAVGEFPDVIGEKIRFAISQNNSELDIDLQNDINIYRDQTNIESLRKIWEDEDLSISVGQKFRFLLKELADTFFIKNEFSPAISNFETSLVIDGDNFTYSSSPGEAQSLTINHKIFNYIFEKKNHFLVKEEIFRLVINNIDSCIAIKRDDNFYLLDATSTINLLSNILCGTSLDIRFEEKINIFSTPSEINDAIHKTFPSSPIFNSYKVKSSSDVNPINIDDNVKFSFEPINF